MTPGVDTLVELVRLAGVTLMATAMVLELLGDRRLSIPAMILAGVLLLAAGSLALVIATVVPLAARLEQPVLPLALDYLQTSSHAPRLLTPILPAVYALLLAEGFRLAESVRARQALAGMLGVSILAMLALMAAGGHVATTNLEHLAMTLQIIHMACGVAWVALVLALIPRLLRGEPLAGILERVGNLAALLVAGLVVSGVSAAWLYDAPLPWPMDEDYGRLLLLKTVMLTGALGAAAWNRFIELRPPVVNEPGLRRILGIESAFLLAALFLATWLSRTPPPG